MNKTKKTGHMISLTNEVEFHCPCFDASEVCNVSLFSLLPSPTLRVYFCNSEDYDNCPIYLANALRGRMK